MTKTIESLSHSNAQIKAKLSTLRSELNNMAAANQQLRSANGEMREQLEAVIQHLRQKGIAVPDLGH